MSAVQQTIELPEPLARHSFAASGGSAFRVIVADPPWKYDEGFVTSSRWWRTTKTSPPPKIGKSKSKPLPYPAMTVEEICAIPVAELADTDCRLWIWTTSRYLPDAFVVMKAWGFEYKQTLVWHKSDCNPLTGSVAPNSAEFLLVGVRGNPPCLKRLASAVVKLPQSKKHSKKPGEWQWLIEQTDEGPRLEMFARRKRHGWHVWGNELANDVEMPNAPAHRPVLK